MDGREDGFINFTTRFIFLTRSIHQRQSRIWGTKRKKKDESFCTSTSQHINAAFFPPANGNPRTAGRRFSIGEAIDGRAKNTVDGCIGTSNGHVPSDVFGTLNTNHGNRVGNYFGTNFGNARRNARVAASTGCTTSICGTSDGDSNRGRNWACRCRKSSLDADGQNGNFSKIHQDAKRQGEF